MYYYEKCDGNFLAGDSHAETQLMVKFRSKEQISSEEYLRLGNSVHLQRNANLDSAPANSGENPYTDHAGETNIKNYFLLKIYIHIASFIQIIAIKNVLDTLNTFAYLKILF